MYYNVQNKDLSDPSYIFTISNSDYTILIDQKGIFENINNLETKLPLGVYHPAYWELFFYEKEIPLNNPPNVAGKWKVVEYRVIDGVNTIENPLKKEFEATFRQNGRFVDSLSEFENYYGVWEILHDNKWSMTMVSNGADNDVYKFTPIELECNCNITKMEQINYEAGTISTSPKQNAEVVYGTWIRIE